MTCTPADLRFDGSVWCNMDVALRGLDQYFRREIRPHGLTVIEWYILRALYAEDGQHASALAQAVGRAATSFTPNLDKLEKKGLIERRQDEHDRRAVRIFLCASAQHIREDVLQSAETIDAHFRTLFPSNEYDHFLKVIATFQNLDTVEI